MRFLLLIPLLLVAHVSSAKTQSALEALKVLPKGVAKNLARIEAREGTPAPEQWHFLVYEPSSPNGLREYAVAGRKIVATKEISQFAEKLEPEDVIDSRALKVDSGKLVTLAKKYARANDLTVASINFKMRKDPETATVLWGITCLDKNGEELGALLVSTDEGTLIAREGFPIEPDQKRTAKRSAKVEEPLQDQAALTADSTVDPEDSPGEPMEEFRDEPEAVPPSPAPSRAGKVEKKSRSRSAPRVRRATAAIPNVPVIVRRATSPVRRIVRSLLPF